MDECPRPRRPWLAAVLSLFFGPLGQIYVGRLRRSLCLWLVVGCLFPVLGICMVELPIGHPGFVLLMLCLAAIPVYLAVDAFLLAKRNRFAPLKPYQRWWIYVLFFLAFAAANNGVAYFIRAFIAEAFVIPTRSMSPTIQPGDRILVDKLWLNCKHLCRGEVVVYRSEGPDSPLFVHRIVGLPGDEIEMKNERLFVNGAAWDDQHAVVDSLLPRAAVLANCGPIRIPADCFFALGDNRRISKDSRITGPIPISAIHGKARMIYWSQERRFPNPDDTRNYTLGPIAWDRIGMRLD